MDRVNEKFEGPPTYSIKTLRIMITLSVTLTLNITKLRILTFNTQYKNAQHNTQHNGTQENNTQ
jgi:hypothetical protein